MTRRPRPKRKSKKKMLKDFEALLVELLELKESLRIQMQRIDERIGAGEPGVWNELNRRHMSVNKSAKKVRAAIRKMKQNPTSASMVLKPGDNTARLVPGGVQGLGTLMQETLKQLEIRRFEM